MTRTSWPRAARRVANWYARLSDPPTRAYARFVKRSFMRERSGQVACYDATALSSRPMNFDQVRSPARTYEAYRYCGVAGGRIGRRRSVMRASARVRPPLRWLQDLQAATTFSQTC